MQGSSGRAERIGDTKPTIQICPLSAHSGRKEGCYMPLRVRVIADRLGKCAVGDCTGCPNRYVDDYQAGCGKLLSDAALLLEVLSPTGPTSDELMLKGEVMG